jgi:hypothetical protein
MKKDVRGVFALDYKNMREGLLTTIERLSEKAAKGLGASSLWMRMDRSF